MAHNIDMKDKKYMDGLTRKYGTGAPSKYQYEGKKCVAGCKNFTAYETKHHKDCPFYPNSLSEYYDNVEAKLAALQPKQEAIESEFLDILWAYGHNCAVNERLGMELPKPAEWLKGFKPEGIQSDAIELIEWLNSECPAGTITYDLSHDFAERLRSRLDKMNNIL